MIFYVILTLIVILNLIMKKRKAYCIFVTSLLVLFAGLRSNITGQDTPQYQYIFNTFVGNSWDYCWNHRAYIEESSEIGYFALNFFISRLADFNMFKLICAAMTLIPACFIIYKYSKFPVLSFMVFFMLPIFSLLSMSAFRQGIAFGFCMYAYHFSIQKKIYPFLFCCCCAFLFHRTSVVILPIYLINYVQYRKNWGWMIYGVLGGIAYVSDRIFSFILQFSRIAYDFGDAGGGRMLVFLLALALFSYFVSEKKLNETTNKYALYSLYMTIAFWLIGMNLAAIFRLAAYTEFLICIYIANTLSSIRLPLLRKGILVVSCIVCLFIMQHLVLNSHHEYPVNPYYFVWEK